MHDSLSSHWKATVLGYGVFTWIIFNMVSQPGSNTSNNLQRTKSTTSVQERRKHPLQAERINSHTAQTHALIAAHRAFDRSRASTSTDMARSESALSRKSTGSRQEQSISFSPATHLRRQRSTLQNRIPKLADTLQIPERANRRLEKYHSVICNDNSGLQGENYGAEPSSYRRLRRARSLYTPIRQTRDLRSEATEATSSQAPTLRTATSSIALQSPGFKLRLKRSLNFLRQHYTDAERLITAPVRLQPKASYHSEAVALARNQYFQDFGQQERHKQPSLLLSAKTKRAQKAFRKSFRTDDDHGTETPPEETNDVSQSKHEKRNTSTSLSNRVKKIFSRSKQDDCMPPQQIEASRDHFGGDVTMPNSETCLDSYGEPETSLTQRNGLYIPSDPNPQPCNRTKQLSQHLSRSSSNESLSSISKSRVTSWTNSTAADSIAARAGAYEPKRLSIIKEDGGPHQPSSSAGRHIGGVKIFQQPLNIPEGQTVDSQRVYSALLRRIDEEQKQMERTQAALKEIHDAQDQDDIIGHYLFSAPTIRRVESNGIAQLASIDEDDPKVHLKDLPQVRVGTIPTLDQDEDIVEKWTKQPEHQAVQSSFYPVSNENKMESPSPFRMLLKKRNGQLDNQSTYELDTDTRSVIVKELETDKHFGNSKFGQSTESVYSKTTNGGTNVDYISPIGSTEDLQSHTHITNGIATILHPSYSTANTPERSSSLHRLDLGVSASQRGAWRGWMEHQMDNLEPKNPALRPNAHIREHAQIDPDETEIGYNLSRPLTQQPRHPMILRKDPRNQVALCSSPDTLVRPKTAHGLRKPPLPFPQLKEVVNNNTPTPSTSLNMRRSQSALFNQTNMVEQPSTDVKKASGLRRISPGNIARMVKVRKSQPTFLHRPSPGKENSPVNHNDSPPVSTPGRHEIQTRNGNSTSRLRKGMSAIGLQQHYDGSTAGGNRVPFENSPADKVKDVFSARLSKPFDMDIPVCNRPFDSMYLGKRQAGNISRLSVAPNDNVMHRPKTYGNLGPLPLSSNEDAVRASSEIFETTALPPLSVNSGAQRSTSGLSFGLAGKRMVSSFLRSRRRHENNTEPSLTGSPAFI